MSWPVVPLGDLLEPQPNGKVLQQGWSPRCHPEPAARGAWGVLKTTAIQDGRFEPEHNKRLPEHLAPRERIEVRAGDLLITCAGPRARCGIPALVRRTPSRLMMSGKMYRLRASDRVLPDFLELWLRSPKAQSLIDNMKTGISDSGLNLTHGRFVGLATPLPPLGEQRRTVDLLEDHLSHLDAAERYLDVAARRLRAWQARMAEELIWLADVRRTPVSALLREPMRNGRSDRAVQAGATGTRTLTLTAVTKRSFSDEHTKLTTTDPERARGLWLEPGDVLVQRSNTPELVGTTARYAGPRDWAIFPDLLIRLRADEAIVDSRYLEAALRSGPGHAQMRSRARGAAGTMPKIDQHAVGSAAIPVPPLSDQLRVVGRLAEAEAALQRLEKELVAAGRRGKGLRRALLSAAFSGRLTATHTSRASVEDAVTA